MKLDEIRALLAAPEAWREVFGVAGVDVPGEYSRRMHDDAYSRRMHEAVDALCDERARQLSQILACDAEVTRQRDAAVRALVAVLGRAGASLALEHLSDHACDTLDEIGTAIAALRALYPEGT